MSKPVPPVRVSRSLYEAAELAGRIEHRSSAKQIEYWATIGQLAAQTLSGNDLLAISSGVAEAAANYYNDPGPEPDALFAAVERDRKAGRLADRVSSSQTRYQASLDHPGLLEQIDSDGRRAIGRFENGQFLPDSGLQPHRAGHGG
jgi:hypothetical protein